MWFYKEGDIIDEISQRKMMERLADEAGKRFNHSIRKVLLFPHDITRCHSGTGKITNMLYHILGSDCHIDIIPTLGQHVQHSRDENQWMFGDIPERCFHVHDWQSSCTLLGEISNEFVKYVSEEERLFVPFRDKTNGKETYMAGRYIDLDEEGHYIQVLPVPAVLFRHYFL